MPGLMLTQEQTNRILAKWHWEFRSKKDEMSPEQLAVRSRLIEEGYLPSEEALMEGLPS